MSSLLDTLTTQLGGETLGRISREIGADERTTGAATGAALSTLIGALARNASKSDGAKALHGALAKDHDGSALDNIDGTMKKAREGAGDDILRHVLGGQRPRVEQGLAKSSGLDAGSMGKLMSMLAPIVLGALGKEQRRSKLDAGSLAQFLGRQQQDVATRAPQAAGLMSQLLDTDKDGDVDVQDLVKHGSGLLGKLFRG